MNTQRKLKHLLLLTGLLCPMLSSAQNWQMKPNLISTRWAASVKSSQPLPEYPRPQMVRSSWINLNGLWEYTITKKVAATAGVIQGNILVPFPIESALSGVKKSLKPDELLWYQRSFEKPTLKSGERLILNFGAVDFEATVYVNGKEVIQHRGGYQSFSADVTQYVKAGKNELVVKVWDPTDQGPNPHGKQVLNPEGIMYTPSSGIWQTVWMEVVPVEHIEGLVITPDVDKGIVTVLVKGAKTKPEIVVYDPVYKQEISRRSASLEMTKDGAKVVISIKQAKLWSPDDPFLYDLEITLGKDKVKSYFGMRKIEVKPDANGKDRIYLNGKYTYNLGTLDQGFWPDGLYTAPTDEALAFDIKASKAMGFNTIRKHIKVEPARWYYWADKLGMLVWQDMVNPGSENAEGKKQFEKECAETIAQLYNYPSIVTWVLFNEKWGQYDQERLTKWMKATDPTRLINGHSGEKLYVNDALRSPSPDAWIGADMTDVHAYPNPGHIAFEKGKAAVLGEFGGIGVPVEGHLWDDLKTGWGYDGVVAPPAMKKQYGGMMDSLKRLEIQGLTASIYTQPFDVETEQNGLMTYDREVIKLPLKVIQDLHARLWPITKNWMSATRGFSAKVADTISQTYSKRLSEYKNGNRDPQFLRGLALLASSHKDTVNAGSFALAYIKSLNGNIDESQAKLIAQFTSRVSDPGFGLLQNWVKANVRKGERNEVTAKLQDIIFKEQVKPNLGAQPDWKKIEEIIAANPYLDGELIRGLSVIYYLNALNIPQQNAAENLVMAASKYDDLYDSGMYNAWAWALFQHTENKVLLEKALFWSKKSVDREPEKAFQIDTYANLLYKLGQKEEALQWEAKALAIDPVNEDFKTTYEKMKRGEKTW